jgi:hypothetical protein
MFRGVAQGRRRLADGDPLEGDPEPEPEPEVEERYSSDNTTMTLRFPIGKTVAISLNITGGSLAEFYVESLEALRYDMEVMRAVFP